MGSIDHRLFSFAASRAKRLVFALIPAVLLLLAATVSLRFLEEKNLIRSERPDDRVSNKPLLLLTKIKKNGADYWAVRDPTMVSSDFLVKKPDRTFRIIVTGESFALGSPYIAQSDGACLTCFGDISNWIRAELAMRFPSLTFEVLNAAAGGQNSSRVRAIVSELVAVNPDLIFVACGNNEGYLPKTAANPSLHRWILYRVLKKTLLSEPDPLERSYFTPQDTDSKRIEENFRGNIRAIVDAARQSGVRLALAAMPIHLKYSPEINPGSAPSALAEEKRDEHVQKGLELIRRGRLQEALESFSESDHPSFTSRRIAEVLEKMGRYREAKKLYKIFVQNYPLNRTRPSYNDDIREICREHDVILADLEKAAEDASPHGIPGSEYFLDSCHMNWRGYQLMAKELVGTLVAREVVKGAEGEPLPAPSVDQMIKRFRWEKLYELP